MPEMFNEEMVNQFYQKLFQKISWRETPTVQRAMWRLRRSRPSQSQTQIN
jgi:hypothetical protein